MNNIMVITFKDGEEVRRYTETKDEDFIVNNYFSTFGEEVEKIVVWWSNGFLKNIYTYWMDYGVNHSKK